VTIEPRGYEYPLQSIRVVPFPAEFADLFTQPIGLTEDVWPSTQINYFGYYLRQLGCKTVLIEGHYIDRDFIDDLALFYSRSLRGYPNYCQRLHFFGEDIDEERWRALITDANHGKYAESSQFLQRAYLGFCVIRPLPGSLIGRTVLQTFPPASPEGHHRDFGATRAYRVHLSGFELEVCGLAFQQQDQGVSACATTALWSAIHKVAPMEELPLPTPAAITQAASRYFLAGGRALPSEGLTIDQICEATRSSGLAPIVVRGLALDQARAQLHGYLTSGFPAVLALKPLHSSDGHAVCAVGLKLGAIAPQTDPKLHFRDSASSVMAVYVHDDRLGPYAVADLQSHTLPGGEIAPVLVIRWPGESTEFETSILRAIVVPVPTKLRLTVARMRSLGLAIAEAVGALLPKLDRRVDVSCRYRLSTDYQQAAFGFGLSDAGLFELTNKTVLSRYFGEIHLEGPSGPLLDVLLDATETQANPSVLCCVCRSGLPAEAQPLVAFVARRLGAAAIV
jgi:hypothetical protein